MRWFVLLILLGWTSGCVTAGSAARVEPHAEPELGGVRHTVREGETLYRIARTYGISEEELADVNRIRNPKALRAGDPLFIPGATRVLSTSSASEEAAAGAVAAREDDGPRGSRTARAALAAAWGAGGQKGEGGAAVGAASALAGGAGAARPGSGAGSKQASPARSVGTSRAKLGPLSPPERRPLGAGTSAGPSRSAGAEFDWPVRGVLYARFGKKGREPHDGIDLAAPRGTPVHTAAAGRVLFAGEQKAYGRIVIVDHGQGLITLYAHNHDLRVKTGQKVREGQVIATVGESGRTSGPHLHFEVRRDGRPVDPLGYLQGKPPRAGAAARRGSRE